MDELEGCGTLCVGEGELDDGEKVVPPLEGVRGPIELIRNGLYPEDVDPAVVVDPACIPLLVSIVFLPIGGGGSCCCCSCSGVIVRDEGEAMSIIFTQKEAKYRAVVPRSLNTVNADISRSFDRSLSRPVDEPDEATPAPEGPGPGPGAVPAPTPPRLFSRSPIVLGVPLPTLDPDDPPVDSLLFVHSVPLELLKWYRSKIESMLAVGLGGLHSMHNS